MKIYLKCATSRHDPNYLYDANGQYDNTHRYVDVNDGLDIDYVINRLTLACPQMFSVISIDNNRIYYEIYPDEAPDGRANTVARIIDDTITNLETRVTLYGKR